MLFVCNQTTPNTKSYKLLGAKCRFSLIPDTHLEALKPKLPPLENWICCLIQQSWTQTHALINT